MAWIRRRGRSRGFFARWFRRLRRLAILGGAGAAFYKWQHGRSGGTVTSGPGSPGGGGGGGRRAPIGGPRSPSALRAVPEPAESEPATDGAAPEAGVPRPAPAPTSNGETTTPPGAGGTASSLASVRPLTTTATRDAPNETATGTTSRSWIDPLDGGDCPTSHPVKANDNSGIYHLPGGRFYDRTTAERCYLTPEAAEADGYRRSKS